MAAAAALRTDTSNDEAWRRALETAMAVCYMRPFTRGAWKLPGKYVPMSRSDVHEGLKELRNKVYAHSDKESGRSASMAIRGISGDIVSLEYRTGWLPFPVEEIHAVQAHCHDLRERFLFEASAIHEELEEADTGDV